MSTTRPLFCNYKSANIAATDIVLVSTGSCFPRQGEQIVAAIQCLTFFESATLELTSCAAHLAISFDVKIITYHSKQSLAEDTMIRNGGFGKRISLLGIFECCAVSTALPGMSYSNYRSRMSIHRSQEGYSLGIVAAGRLSRQAKIHFKDYRAYRDGDYGIASNTVTGDYNRGFKEAFERAYDYVFYGRGYRGQRVGIF